MLAWLDFFNLLFWLVLFLILCNNTNFLSLLLFSEFMWILLYCFSSILGAINDDLLLLSFSFYFLGLAGVEFSFGLLLIVLFKQYNFSINLSENSRISAKKSQAVLNRNNWI